MYLKSWFNFYDDLTFMKIEVENNILIIYYFPARDIDNNNDI